MSGGEKPPKEAGREFSWLAGGHGARRAILVVDIVGSVPLMERHEADVADRWMRFVQEVRVEVLPRHGVRLVKSLGDGLRLLAPDVPAATAAAQEILRRLAAYNSGRDGDQLLRLHTGIHLAHVTENDLDIYGRGVNLAARLAQQSEPGQILLTAEANEQLLPLMDLPTQDLGDMWFKGIEAPVRVFSVCDAGESVALLAPPRSGVVRPMVAVLPFSTDSDDSARIPLGELLTDDIICALSQLGDLQVVSRLSTTALARRRGDPRAQAPALGADFLVSGVCRAVGTRVVVHAELFDVRRCDVVDRVRESGSLRSLASVESPLVSALVHRLVGAILERQIDLARRCALPNLAGYTLLLGGIALMHRLSKRDFLRARQLLEHLSERWPRLATPHAWLGRWHLFSVLQRWSSDVKSDQRAANEACQRALELDDESSVALAVSGSVRIGLSQDVEGGISFYDRALAVNPNDSFAWMLRGTAHAFRGDGPDALRDSNQARVLSPLDPLHFLYDCHAAAAALAADEPTKARDLAERSMRANSQHLSTYRVLAIAQMLCGDGAAAQGTVRRLRVIDPTASVDGYLRTAPSAAYPIGQRFAKLLAEAGLPQSTGGSA